jgi:hypothetical protein
MRMFEYEMRRLHDAIDRRRKSKEVDEDVLGKNLTHVDKDTGERTWTFKD